MFPEIIDKPLEDIEQQVCPDLRNEISHIKLSEKLINLEKEEHPTTSERAYGGAVPIQGKFSFKTDEHRG